MWVISTRVSSEGKVSNLEIFAAQAERYGTKQETNT